MKVLSITEREFEMTDGSRRLIVHDNARRFGAIALGTSKGAYVLSWRSDLIEPNVCESDDALRLWVGVDQHVAGIDLRTGSIGLSLHLNGNVLQLIRESDFVVVVTELEVIAFNADFSLRSIRGLPDVPDAVSVQGNEVTVRLMTNQELRFDL